MLNLGVYLPMDKVCNLQRVKGTRVTMPSRERMTALSPPPRERGEKEER